MATSLQVRLASWKQHMLHMHVAHLVLTCLAKQIVPSHSSTPLLDSCPSLVAYDGHDV